MHKGFKCLDVKEGRVYISRDVVSDEEVCPFSTCILMLELSFSLKSVFFLHIFVILVMGITTLLTSLIMVPCSLTVFFLSLQVMKLS